MRIERIVSPTFELNSYCITENQHLLLIDPVEINSILSKFKRHTIDFTILTHEHIDHICGVNVLKRLVSTVVISGEKAKNGLSDPSVNMSRYVDVLRQFIPFGTGEANSYDYTCQADRYAKDMEIIYWQRHKLLFKETPGHSSGSICVLIDDKYLFSGDTIFKDYPTATRMPGGSTKAFKAKTNPWLESLSPDVIVFPGHTYSFSLGERYKTSH